MNVLVTGGAGFIGSYVVDALLADGHSVTIIDNFNTGSEEFVARHAENARFRVVKGDLIDKATVQSTMRGQDFVWHMAAKADVKTYGIGDFEKDVACAANVLDAMHGNGVKKIVFSSSSTVYGEARQIPTPEDAPLQPISLYGASKVACESLILGCCASFGMQSWIFRFANIIGQHGTHGVIVDFIGKLRRSPAELEILGDGKQAKSYLLVQDCVAGMLRCIERSDGVVNVFNLGNDDWITVGRIGEIVSKEMAVNPDFRFAGGKRGWIGDVPRMRLSCDMAKGLGWKPTFDSEEAVRTVVKLLLGRKN